MQVLAFNLRVLFPTVRIEIRRQLKEATKLIIARGMATEESRRGPKLVFCDHNWCIVVPRAHFCPSLTS